MSITRGQLPDGGFRELQLDELGRLRIAFQPPKPGETASTFGHDLFLSQAGALLVTRGWNE